jgi:hypothetical protein
MKPFHLLAMAALLVLPPASAQAQQRPAGSGLRITYPNSANHFSWENGHGFHGGIGNVWVVEREVVREVVRQTPPPPAAVPLPEQAQGGTQAPRKPYVIGASYASLPGSCMKLIEEGVTYYYCSGEWYQQVGDRRSATYRAVARRL